VRIRFTGAAVAAVSLVVLAACTTAAPGTPIPDQVNSTETPTSGDSPTEELPSNGAPKVENPIDATHFEQNPCDALTPAQASRLNVPPEGQAADTEFGGGCIWRNPDSGGATGISFLSSVRRGLSIAYAEESAGYYRYFKPIDDLEGFPAAIFDTGTDKPTSQCSITVGLSDDLAFQTLTNLSRANIGKTDPCEAGVMATREMLKTIKANS
jgi:hypothetical protein